MPSTLKEIRERLRHETDHDYEGAHYLGCGLSTPCPGFTGYADVRDLLQLVRRMHKVIAIWESYFKEVSDAKGWFDHAMGKNRAKKFDAEVAALITETEESCRSNLM